MARQLAPLAPSGCRSETLGELGVGICHAPLRAIDRIDGVPISDAQAGITLVASARLDDRAGLGAAIDIAPAELARMTDSALILRAWLRWGEDFVSHLLGDFVVAIWDERRRRLVLARDPMGQRDLFYHVGRDLLAFAPDVPGLWALSEVPRALEDSMLCNALTQDFTATPGATLFTGIDSLPGGHLLIAQPGREPELRAYWEPHASSAHIGRDESYYVEAYRAILGDAVATRLDGLEKPPGLLLSGGFDSSAIAGLARDPLERSGQRLVAAASVMPSDYSGTIRHAGRWVDLCARDMPWLDIRRVTRDGLDPIADIQRRLTERQTLPSVYDPVDAALCAELASGGARLAMDGHGGDYTLNPRGRHALARWLAVGEYRRFARELLAARRTSNRSIASLVRHDVVPHLLPARLRRWAAARQRAQLPVQRGFVETAGSTPLDRKGRGGLCWAIDLVRRSSGSASGFARHGLTLSRPFHDRRVVELALAIPPDLHVRDGHSRHLARTALQDVYPAEFQRRGRANDDPFPDFQPAIDRARPALLADLERMQQSPSLAVMIDFSRLRSLLAAMPPGAHRSGWEQDTHTALNTYCVARYVEWFRRDNRLAD
ncbi:asparagine synthetase B family protein [Sphingomonas canadensis]|uniref:asparagine synthase (glutamine-hydrolyzing) n=2 Tax=Sphingomonas canadensis TaxID=1219257 RepID=A0ABW3HC97_9SPHN|nr:asparagine synthase-related protein [Sphingomonas canadensis]